jgi:ABC-2 type transport system ATP-binding protein
MADDGVSVVLSSHLLSELERVADHLVLIAGGRVRIDGPVDELIAHHRVVRTQSGEPASTTDWETIEVPGGPQTHRLVRLRSHDVALSSEREARSVGIEELAMAYLREGAPQRLPALNGAPR